MYLRIEGEVVPDQSDLLNTLPLFCNSHLIESQLPVCFNIFLRWEPVGGFVIVNFEDRIIHQGHTVNKTSNPVILLFFQGEIDMFFEAQGFSMIKGTVTPVIIRDTLFSK